MIGGMSSCSLCPPGSADIPEREIEEHRRVRHPEAWAERTLEVDGSVIVRDASAETELDAGIEEGEWHH
jgi:hypothetical protein